MYSAWIKDRLAWIKNRHSHTCPGPCVSFCLSLSLSVCLSLSLSLSLSLCRVKLKEGVTFLGARPSNPAQWMVSQDVRSEGYRVVTLRCRRKQESVYDQRSALPPSGFKCALWVEITRSTWKQHPDYSLHGNHFGGLGERKRLMICLNPPSLCLSLSSSQSFSRFPQD